MNRLSSLFAFFFLLSFLILSFSEECAAQIRSPQTRLPKYQKRVLSDQFHAEGACIGDFNRDGIPDVAVGHFWYAGPQFDRIKPIFDGNDAKNFDPATEYSECFGMFSDDFNGDGWDDILICPHPGKSGYWYENPKNVSNTLWKKHFATKELGNESQDFGNILHKEQKSLLFNRNGFFGFAMPNQEKPYEPWEFIPVSLQDKRFHNYTHGLGFGNINGDGKVDILEREGWWEQPDDPKSSPWKFHSFPFADAAAHMVVYDVDGDGLNDVVAALHCHLYGFAWYKQIRKDDSITFDLNVLIPRSDTVFDSNENDINGKPFPNVSQLHALVAADMNGDGITDVVTGKRFWAHGPKGDVEPDAPAVLMWWETHRSGKDATLIPHIIDENSGVGTQFAVGDLNGDRIPDIVTGNKKGAFLFLSEKEQE